MLFRSFLYLAVGLATCLAANDNVTTETTVPPTPTLSYNVTEQPEVESIQQFSRYNRYFVFRVGVRDSYELLEDVKDAPLSKDGYTAVIVHGHQGTAFTSLNTILKDAFLMHAESNEVNMSVIVMDWEAYADLTYSNSAMAVPMVAEGLVEMLQKLVKASKIALEKLHLIGFDLGAHLVGITGRRLDGAVARITGLDPSGEGWINHPLCLKPTDAKYVEVIHTDVIGVRALGINAAMGHIDFYPNGGTTQPGCTTNSCNHERAWELFAASLTHTDRLVGNRCENISQMTSNRCVGFTVPMGGVNLYKQGSGLYRLNTGKVYPFIV